MVLSPSISMTTKGPASCKGVSSLITRHCFKSHQAASEPSALILQSLHFLLIVELVEFEIFVLRVKRFVLLGYVLHARN